MARNERGRHLDKSTRNHLSALDAYIQEQAEAAKPKQPDEFTLNEYISKMAANGLEITESSANRQTSKLVAQGKISKRAITLNGTKTNLFRFI